MAKIGEVSEHEINHASDRQKQYHQRGKTMRMTKRVAASAREIRRVDDRPNRQFRLPSSSTLARDNRHSRQYRRSSRGTGRTITENARMIRLDITKRMLAPLLCMKMGTSRERVVNWSDIMGSRRRTRYLRYLMAVKVIARQLRQCLVVRARQSHRGSKSQQMHRKSTCLHSSTRSTA